jgi:glucose-1-phosphate thymidylyltransferase
METTQTDKVVVLARGLGTRMRRPDDSSSLDDRQAAVARTGVKALMPIDRPFLDYVLSAAARAGYRRVCLVVGPQHDELRDYYGRQLRPQRITIEFAVQEEPKGTAHAVAAAESFAGDDAFAVMNSDTYYPVEALRALRRQTGSAVALFDQESMLAGSNVPEERLSQFAVGQVDEQGFLERIIEKPDQKTLSRLPKPLWLSMNCWQFRPVIFEACRAIGPSPRGEFEIPYAVQHAIDVLGERFRAVPVRAAVLDLSSRQDVAPVAARLAGTKVRL